LFHTLDALLRLDITAPESPKFGMCKNEGGVGEVPESERSSSILSEAATIKFTTYCSILNPQSVKSDRSQKSNQNCVRFDVLEKLGSGGKISE